MTVQQIIKKLENYDKDMEVYMSERVSEFTYGAVNSISISTINFMESPGGEVLSINLCVVFSEE